MKEFYTTYTMKTKTRHVCSQCGLEIEDGSIILMKGKKFHWTFTHKECLNGGAPKDAPTETMPDLEEETCKDIDAMKDELCKMTVSELRKLARSKGHKGAVILSLSKDQLIETILSGIIPTKTEKTQPAGDDLADIIANALKDKITANVNLEDIEALIDMKLDDIASKVKPTITTVEVKNIDKGTVKNLGVQHKDFPELLKLAQLRMNTMLVGPSGSGKTHVCSALAKALDLPFYFISVGMQTTKTDLLGYMDANGNYVPTLLRKAYEFGGVFLLDEIDAGNSNVIIVLNALLSNGHGSFPDRMVEKHPDFIFLCAGNTFGKGSDRVFVGRNQLDGATLNRFKTWFFDYDERLELALSTNETWCKKVQAIRKATETLKERVVVSPRASIEGSLLLDAGFSEKAVLEMTIFQGTNKETQDRIMNNIRA